MRAFLSSLMMVLSVTVYAAGQVRTWEIDPANSAAQFSVRHLGISTVRGAFTRMSGSVHYDAVHPESTTIDATIDAASIDTRVERRDNDLRGQKYFDVVAYPTLTFKSSKVETMGAGKLKVTGDLTMHGVTRQVVLDIEGPSAEMNDGKGKMRMGAEARTTINRKDFGVNGGSAVVGDDVPINIDVELVRPGGS